MPRIEVDPRQETPVTSQALGPWQLRYAYARSADSRAAGDPGQDYLAFELRESALVFALCDGVSQSFYGDLAARRLAQGLVEWLTREPPPADQATFCQALERFLVALVGPASQAVAAYELPADLPDMLRQVLEEKRGLGSESTFVCGRLDRAAGVGGRVWLAWMGDSRLRLWSADGEVSDLLGGRFDTEQRWSSRRGPVGGKPHCFVGPLAGLRQFAAYSDGLVSLDTHADLPPDPALNSQIAGTGAAADSDDIALLAVTVDLEAEVAPPPPPPGNLAAVDRVEGPILQWTAVPEADFYQVEVRNGRRQIDQVEQPPWAMPDDWPAGPYRLRVRTVRAARTSAWTEMATIERRPQPAVRPPRPEPARRGFDWVIGLLSLLLVALLACSGLIFLNPAWVLDRIEAVRQVVATPTATAIATPTSTLTPTPAPTTTPRPPAPTVTVVPLPPTFTPVPTELLPTETPTAMASATLSPTVALSPTVTQTAPAAPDQTPSPTVTASPAATTSGFGGADDLWVGPTDQTPTGRRPDLAEAYTRN